MKNQDNKNSPEATNFIVLGSKESKLAETQDKDFKYQLWVCLKTLKTIWINALMKTGKIQTVEMK